MLVPAPVSWSLVNDSGPNSRVAAGLVHAYTAIGAALALLMVHFSYEGEVALVLWLFLAAMIIDGTDGFLARYFRVKAVMPSFDGELLDNIVDYLTYAFAPMVLLWANGYLPGGAWGWALAIMPLLASCYGFCRSDAKTEDHYFLGFPSYWNILAFYVIVMGLSETTTAVLVVVLTILVFVPVKYLYPSRTVPLWTLNMTLAVIWLAMYAVIVVTLPDPSLTLVWVSMFYVAYYTGVSLWLTATTARRRRLEPTPVG